jgi:hypothetical protein
MLTGWLRTLNPAMNSRCASLNSGVEKLRREGPQHLSTACLMVREDSQQLVDG